MNKYFNILIFDNKQYWDLLINVFDRSIEYINKNYKNQNIEHKIAAIYVAKQFYIKNSNISLNEISNIINKFFNYVGLEYHPYRNQFEIISDEFHLKLSFYDAFIKKILSLYKS